MRTCEACIRDVVAAKRNSFLTDAAMLMRENHVGSIVVLDQDNPRKPVGIVTDRDIVVEVVAEGLDPRNMTLGEIMGTTLVTAWEDDDALLTLKLMRRTGVRRVPVVDADGNLAGIVSLNDLLEYAGDALDDIVTAIHTERAVEAAHRP